MKDFLFTEKVRNNRILKAIESVNGSPGQIWCKDNGLSYTIVNNLINMTISPLNAEGSLSKNAARLLEVVGKLPDELWSNEQLYPLERNFSNIEMDYDQVLSMIPAEQQFYPTGFSKIEKEQTKAILLHALSSLTLNEREVIIMKFYDELTDTQISKRLNLSKSRIAQIQNHAIRTLRSKEKYPELFEIGNLNSYINS